MQYCNSCGEKIEDNAKVCPSCGKKFAEQSNEQQTYQAPNQENKTNQQQNYQQQNYQQQDYGQNQNQNQNQNYIPYDQSNMNYNQQPQYEKPSGVLNTGMLVWSIINLVLCCQLFGIIALIFTITANSTATAQEEKKKLDTAKTLNLIGTIFGSIIIIVYIILFSMGTFDVLLNM